MDKQKYFEGIASYRLLAKHEIGQNFLIDPSICERIVSCLEAKEGETILEIGSGAGSLSYFLSLGPAQSDLIDIDDAMVTKLKQDFEGNEFVKPQYGNAAKWDYSKYDKIIGNLPYYITSLILEMALLRAKNAKRMVFMVQKEAAERLFSAVGTKEYGPLPILLALTYKKTLQFSVSRNAFAPAPHVDSTVFVLDSLDADHELVNEVYRLAKALFLQRRKTLLNNLRAYCHDGEKAKSAMEECGLALTLRPEQLTPMQYCALYSALIRVK